MKNGAEFDLVVYGASGFTGRLVAEHLASRYGARSSLRWAMAGRSAAKLTAVRDEIGAPDTPLIVADAHDTEALTILAARTRTVITTAGPFQLYGSDLVAACAAGGTDYLDLSGETVWMRHMIDAHHKRAQASGARVLFSCGFDSIPFELGVLHLQAAARACFGHVFPRIKGRVRTMRGGFSGGTTASGRATAATIARDPDVLALLRDPFCLTPGFRGPAQPLGVHPAYDDDLQAWTAPFIMAPINTRNVHRSNLLQGHVYGTDFVYDEMFMTGPGVIGEAAAQAIAASPYSIGGEQTFEPGDGPDRDARQAGSYDLLFLGRDGEGNELRTAVTGDCDPGYGSTSKIIAEAAICLLKSPTIPGGCWTPGAAMGGELVKRLSDTAGLTFRLEES